MKGCNVRCYICKTEFVTDTGITDREFFFVTRQLPAVGSLVHLQGVILCGDCRIAQYTHDGREFEFRLDTGSPGVVQYARQRAEQPRPECAQYDATCTGRLRMQDGIILCSQHVLKLLAERL